jgi:hypothetical protein
MKKLIFIIFIFLALACQEEKIVIDQPEQVDEPTTTENTNLRVNRRPDLFIINSLWGGPQEVKLFGLYGNTNPPYRKVAVPGHKWIFGFNAHTNMDFSNCDMNNDGYYDQIGILKAPGFRTFKTVSIFYKDGIFPNAYTNDFYTTIFPLPSNPAQFEYLCGDIDGNGSVDLLQIQKFSDHIIVKGLSGSNYFGTRYRTYLSPEFQAGIRVNIPNANNSHKWEYHCAKGTTDRDNLVLIHKNNTPSGKTEVLIYYSSVLFRSHDRCITGIHPTGDNFTFRFGRYDPNSDRPDLFAFKLNNTGSGKFEVHVFKGDYFISQSYRERLKSVATPFGELNRFFKIWLR